MGRSQNKHRRARVSVKVDWAEKSSAKKGRVAHPAKEETDAPQGAGGAHSKRSWERRIVILAGRERCDQARHCKEEPPPHRGGKRASCSTPRQAENENASEIIHCLRLALREHRAAVALKQRKQGSAHRSRGRKGACWQLQAAVLLNSLWIHRRSGMDQREGGELSTRRGRWRAKGG